jgi:hypothetical protein
MGTNILGRKKGNSTGLAKRGFLPRLENLEDRLAPANFEVTLPSDNGPGSFRHAILRANANPGHDTISFTILGGGLHTIRLQSPLPAIADSVTIDGYTQPGARPNTMAVGSDARLLIELDGSDAGDGANGLEIVGGNATVRGLIVNQFKGRGFFIYGNGGNTIAGNYVGTDPSGMVELSNLGSATDINNSPSNRFGGGSPADRNVIAGTGFGLSITGTMSTDNIVQGNYFGTTAAGTSGIGQLGDCINISGGARFNLVGTNGDGINDLTELNVISGADWAGVALYGSRTTNNVVAGNYIGVDATGTLPIPNTWGVALGYPGDGGPMFNLIGTNGDGIADEAERNVISGNGQGVHFGIYGAGGIEHNVVAGNYIGLNAAGTGFIPNGTGVWMGEGAQLNRIGARFANPFAANEANLIAGNHGEGVVIDGGATLGNQIRSATYANGGPGIDLVNGGNAEQPAPTIGVRRSEGSFTIGAGLEGPVSTTYVVDVYVSSACDPSGYGEGGQYVGSFSFTTDLGGEGGGRRRFQGNFPPDYVVTATATSPEGNTSEFSRCSPRRAGGADDRVVHAVHLPLMTSFEDMAHNRPDFGQMLRIESRPAGYDGASNEEIGDEPRTEIRSVALVPHTKASAWRVTSDSDLSIMTSDDRLM